MTAVPVTSSPCMAAVSQRVGPGMPEWAEIRGKRLVVKSIPFKMGRKSLVIVMR